MSNILQGLYMYYRPLQNYRVEKGRHYHFLLDVNIKKKKSEYYKILHLHKLRDMSLIMIGN